MEVRAYFSNIHKVIIDHLRQGETEISAAVAWFTDRDIFDVLCEKARRSLSVSVVLIGDHINQGAGSLNFEKLRSAGGTVTFLPPGSRYEPIMHHKFCVIDRKTVITGSYNWSHKARSNDENITVVTGAADFAGSYFETFREIVARGSESVPLTEDADAVRRRLEMIRNLVLLGEQSDIPRHLSKLQLVATELRLEPIVNALENAEYKKALELIEAHLRTATALVVGSSHTAILRFRLAILEVRLQSLSDEKTDVERRLIAFNRRHSEALGDLIQRVLHSRAELARLQWVANAGRSSEDAEAKAEAAQHAYTEYARHHEELQHARPLPRLDATSERDIRSLYRKACSLCHPDKVLLGDKDAAHRMFVQLQECYKTNDLQGVRAIYDALLGGSISRIRSSRLSETEGLHAAIAEVEHGIFQLVAELKALQASEGVRFMAEAGICELDWDDFFIEQRGALEAELASLESAISVATGQKRHCDE